MILLGFEDLVGRAEAGPEVGVEAGGVDTFDKELTRRRVVADLGGMICSWLARSIVDKSSVALYQQSNLFWLGAAHGVSMRTVSDGVAGLGFWSGGSRLRPWNKVPCF